MFTSTDPRNRHTDPLPWLDTITGRRFPYLFGIGGARDSLRLRVGIHESEVEGLGDDFRRMRYAPRAECVPVTSNPVNPILALFRGDDSRDNAYGTHEWLFQLARHWALWQSPAIGTFPLDYRDPSGPCDRAYSEETGEDAAYWAIDDAIRAHITEIGGIVGDGDPWEWATDDFDTADKIGANVPQMIAHATAVLARLDAAYMARGDL
jgi:hypothetical protein